MIHTELYDDTYKMLPDRLSPGYKQWMERNFCKINIYSLRHLKYLNFSVRNKLLGSQLRPTLNVALITSALALKI